MNTITGMVEAITPMNGVSKRTGKPYTIWTATVDGQEVKMGFTKPSFNVGDTVSLDTEVNKYGDTEVIKPGARGSAPAPRSAPAGGGSAPAARGGFDRTFPVKTNSPEMSIIRQNALTNANAAVHHYMERNHGEVTEPETVEAYIEMVIETAYKFAEFSSGQREAKAVAELRSKA
jgi:hypothetical protein